MLYLQEYPHCTYGNKEALQNFKMKKVPRKMRKKNQDNFRSPKKILENEGNCINKIFHVLIELCPTLHTGKYLSVNGKQCTYSGSSASVWSPLRLLC